MSPQDYRRIVLSIKTDDNLRNRIRKNVISHNAGLPFFKRFPVYRLGLVCSCVLVLVGAIIVVPRLSNRPALSNAVSGSTVQSSSFTSFKPASSVTSKTQNSTVQKRQSSTVSTIPSQAAPANRSSASSGNTMAVGGITLGNNPVILDFDHRLYGIVLEDSNIQPKDTVGRISYLGERGVFTIEGVSLSDGICIPEFDGGSKVKTTKYAEYDYLCDETIQIRGLSYSFTTGSQLNDVCRVESSSSEVESSNSQNKNHSYLIQRIVYPDLNPKFTSIVDKIIGQIPTGDVYSIDEIDPSEAIAIKSKTTWFLVTKRYGYSGKTIDDVLKDKGIQNNAIK